MYIYIYVNLNWPEPLCPSHLPYGRRITSLPCPLVSEDPKDPDYLATPIHGMFTCQTQLIQHFQPVGNKSIWQPSGNFIRWRVHTLHKWLRLGMWSSYMMTHPGPAGRWPWLRTWSRGMMGMHVQTVEVRTSSGRTNQPIAKVYPLEI